MTSNYIYEGDRIVKISNYAEKGDVDYMPDHELPTIVGKTRFMLKDVQRWEEFFGEMEDNGQYFQGYDNSMFTSITLNNGDKFTITETIDDFSELMKSYYKYVDSLDRPNHTDKQG